MTWDCLKKYISNFLLRLYIFEVVCQFEIVMLPFKKIHLMKKYLGMG